MNSQELLMQEFENNQMGDGRKCHCGGDEESYEFRDGHGIYLFRACKDCFPEKRSKYRADIFGSYQTDEQIDEDY